MAKHKEQSDTQCGCGVGGVKPQGRFEDKVKAGYAAFVRKHGLLGARKWGGKKFVFGAKSEED